MINTFGYHIVISGYGLWLPGDERGYWSETWDEELGFIEPHKLHEGDPVRLRMSLERQSHPRVLLSDAMVSVIEETMHQCRAKSDWRVVAASIERTHTHLLLTYSPRNIDDTVKWLKDQSTKAVHRRTEHQGPVWCKGSWRSYIFTSMVWQNTREYIERHNTRRGVGPRPYTWLDNIEDS